MRRFHFNLQRGCKARLLPVLYFTKIHKRSPSGNFFSIKKTINGNHFLGCKNDDNDENAQQKRKRGLIVKDYLEKYAIEVNQSFMYLLSTISRAAV